MKSEVKYGSDMELLRNPEHRAAIRVLHAVQSLHNLIFHKCWDILMQNFPPQQREQIWGLAVEIL